jgi:hypothetical protein
VPRRGAPQSDLRKAGNPLASGNEPHRERCQPSRSTQSMKSIRRSRPSSVSGGSGPRISRADLINRAARGTCVPGRRTSSRAYRYGSTGTVPPCQSAALLETAESAKRVGSRRAGLRCCVLWRALVPAKDNFAVADGKARHRYRLAPAPRSRT